MTLLALNVADLITTERLVEDGHATEANPLMAGLVGTWGGWATKTLVPAALVLAVLRAPASRWSTVLVAGVAAAYGVVVAWNIYGLAVT